MQSRLLYLSLVTAMFFGAGEASSLSANPPDLRLLIAEVQPGVTQAQQYCTLVFADRRFHYERASLHHGKDLDRKIYEGDLPEADWNTLTGILENKEFVSLNVPREIPPLVMEDTHVYTISVARESHFQNMEFLNNKSRKPYDPQLKPLLEWWKSFRKERLSQTNAAPDSRCSMDTEHPIFSH